MLISYKMISGIITTNCTIKSGGESIVPIITKIKYAYFLVFLKKRGVTKFKLVKNIIISGSSKNTANGMVILKIKRKYFSTVKIVSNIPLFKDRTNGRIISMKI